MNPSKAKLNETKCLEARGHPATLKKHLNPLAAGTPTGGLSGSGYSAARPPS